MHVHAEPHEVKYIVHIVGTCSQRHYYFGIWTDLSRRV